MWHATPCIRPATFTSALQLHACDMQLHAFAMRHANSCMCHAFFACNISETEKVSKQLNQSDASIIKVFDFCLATAHVFRNHCAVELCTHALCTCCQLWSALQYPTLSLWSDCINPTDHATGALWAPHIQVQFMRSTPSQWIMPRNLLLGLLMHVAPPLTWWYSCMHSLCPSGSKFLYMNGFFHSMILILWL